MELRCAALRFIATASIVHAICFCLSLLFDYFLFPHVLLFVFSVPLAFLIVPLKSDLMFMSSRQ